MRAQHRENAELRGRQLQRPALVLEHGRGDLVRAAQQEPGPRIEAREGGGGIRGRHWIGWLG
jgi:hypothetical protein